MVTRQMFFHIPCIYIEISARTLYLRPRHLLSSVWYLIRASWGDRIEDDTGEQVPIIGALCELVIRESGDRMGDDVSMPLSSSSSLYLTFFLTLLLLETGVLGEGEGLSDSRPYLLATWLGAWHLRIIWNSSNTFVMTFYSKQIKTVNVYFN